MCCDRNDQTLPDPAYKSEYEAASKLTKVHLFNIFDLNSINLPASGGKLIYHGWMMPPAIYRLFYERCKNAGYKLINTPEQYVGCHYFDGWYDAIKTMTPESIIVEIGPLRTMADQVVQFMRKNECAVILKDYVKSLKHLWNEACFIPRDASFLDVTKVVANFLSVKDEMQDLQGNLVVKKFVNMKQIGIAKSGMPFIQEFRTFVANKKLLPTAQYWSEGSYAADVPSQSFIEDIAHKIYRKTRSNFFTIDTAQLQDGSWTCVEVGDGQVSALPNHEDRDKFFNALLM